jgi:hypothetical protein
MKKKPKETRFELFEELTDPILALDLLTKRLIESSAGKDPALMHIRVQVNDLRQVFGLVRLNDYKPSFSHL